MEFYKKGKKVVSVIFVVDNNSYYCPDLQLGLYKSKGLLIKTLKSLGYKKVKKSKKFYIDKVR